MIDDDPLLSLANEAFEIPTKGDAARPSTNEGGYRTNKSSISHRQALAARDNSRPSMPGVIPTSQPIEPTQRTTRLLPPPVSHRNAAFVTSSRSGYVRRPPQTSTATSSHGYVDAGQGSLIKRHTGLNVKNPLVSSSHLQAKLTDLTILKINQVKDRHRSTGLTGGWATLAVIGEVSPAREGKNGSIYTIWKLTDLETTPISAFVFGKAYQELKRDVSPGTMVAVFNPKVRSDSGAEFSLSIDRADQVLILGKAAEFGYCQARRKDGGGPCRVPVNTSRCNFCSHHVASEYKKIQPVSRIELQGNSLKSAFQPGMRSTMRWEPGKFQTEEAAKRPRMAAASADQLREAAAAAGKRGASSGARYVNTVADPHAVKAQMQELELAKSKQSVLARDAAPIPLARTAAVVMQDPMSNKRYRKKKGNWSGDGGGALPAAKKSKPGEAAAAQNDDEVMIELDDDDDELLLELEASRPQLPAAKASGSGGGAGSDEARKRAEEIIKAKKRAETSSNNSKPTAGSIPSGVFIPNFLKVPLEQKQQKEQQQQQDDDDASAEAAPSRKTTSKSASRPATVPAGKTFGTGSTTQFPIHKAPPALAPSTRSSGPTTLNALKSSSYPKPESKAHNKPASSGFAAAFGSVIAEMEAEQAAGAVKGSLYKEAVEQEDADMLFSTMEVLEKKDEMANKMDSIKHLEVTGWRCEACQCTVEYRPKECAEKHPRQLKKVQVVKRWWQCGSCKGRFTTVGVRYPKGRCPKCDRAGVDFISASMLRPQKQMGHEVQQSNVAGREMLLARGVEQKWVNQ